MGAGCCTTTVKPNKVGNSKPGCGGCMTRKKPASAPPGGRSTGPLP